MTRAVNIAQSGGNNVTMRNRIINGAMMIDQRGSASTPVTTASYSVDRWRTSTISGGTYSIAQVTDAPTGFVNSVKYTVTGSTTANDYNYIYQLVEANNVIDLAWGTANGLSVTVSFWVKSSLSGQFQAYIRYSGPTSTIYTANYTVNAANTWQYVSLQIPAPSSSIGAFANALNTTYLMVAPVVAWSSGYTNTGAGNAWASAPVMLSGSVNIGSTASATFQFTGVQLEAGTTATPFEQRLYGTELALCQRYYYRNNASATYSMLGVFGMASSTTGLNGFPTLPVTMRSTPSISTSASRLADASTGYSISSYSVAQASTVSPEIVFISSGLTTYRTYYLQASNNVAAYIDYSAEL